MNIFFYFQFALVHHFTKLGAGEYYLEELEHEVIFRALQRHWVLSIVEVAGARKQVKTH